MDRRGQVVTFYSFKGGVGRSMALANLAAIYAQRGKRVLALDFDFEAPGLHRYFLSEREEGGAARHEPNEPRQGVLNFFQAVHDELQKRYPDGRGFDTAEAQEKLPGLLGNLLDSGDYLYTVQINDPNLKRTAPERVHFIAAARFDETYPELVRAFDWRLFYDAYAEVFPALARELSRRYDHVLIDSRTGVTDIGSICTMLLPDKLVLAFTPNEQSLRGALDAGLQAVEGRKAMQDRPPLQVFPLLSRVEDGEEALKRKWVARAQQGFEQLFQEGYRIERPDLTTYFSAVRVPHRGYYAYGERIAAEEQLRSETGSLAQVYHQLAECLGKTSLVEAQRTVFQSGFDQDEEFVRSFFGQVRRGLPRVLAMQTHFGPMIRLTEATVELERGHYSEALEGLEDLIEQHRAAADHESSQWLAIAMNLKAAALAGLHRSQDAISTWEELVRRFGKATDPEVRNTVVSALVSETVCLMDVGQHAEALVVCEEVLRQLDGANEPAQLERIARALSLKVAVLGALGRLNEALATCDLFMRRFGESGQEDIQLEIARCLSLKSELMHESGNREEALAASAEMLHRFGDASDSELRELVADVLIVRIQILRESGDTTALLAAYDDFIKRFSGSSDAGTRRKALSTFAEKGHQLTALRRYSDATASYVQAAALFRDAPEPEIQQLLPQVLNDAGFALLCQAKEAWQAGDQEAARRLLQEASAHFSSARERASEDPFILGNAGYAAYLLGKVDEARELLTRAMALGGKPIREAELADSDIHPLPEDEGFRLLLRSIPANESPTASGGLQPGVSSTERAAEG